MQNVQPTTGASALQRVAGGIQILAIDVIAKLRAGAKPTNLAPGITGLDLNALRLLISTFDLQVGALNIETRAETRMLDKLVEKLEATAYDMRQAKLEADEELRTATKHTFDFGTFPDADTMIKQLITLAKTDPNGKNHAATFNLWYVARPDEGETVDTVKARTKQMYAFAEATALTKANRTLGRRVWQAKAELPEETTPKRSGFEITTALLANSKAGDLVGRAVETLNATDAATFLTYMRSLFKATGDGALAFDMLCSQLEMLARHTPKTVKIWQDAEVAARAEQI